MPVASKKLKDTHSSAGTERNSSSPHDAAKSSPRTTSVSTNPFVVNVVSSVRTLSAKSNVKLGFGKKFSSTHSSMNQCYADPFRFTGEGIDFKAKLIGEQDVFDSRGDQMCQSAMQSCKVTLFNFPVNKVSFIAKDVTDDRAFGFVYGNPNEKHKFYGIKTEKSAGPVVFCIRDMFQIVYEIKKKEIEEAKQQRQPPIAEHQPSSTVREYERKPAEFHGTASEVVPVANLLDLEQELHNLEQGVKTINDDWATFSVDSEQADKERMINNSQSAPNGFNSMIANQTGNAHLNQTATTNFDQDFLFGHTSTVSRPVPPVDIHHNTHTNNNIHLPPPTYGHHHTKRSHTNHEINNMSTVNNPTNQVEDDFFVVHSNPAPSQEALTFASFLTTTKHLDPFDTSHVNHILNDTTNLNNPTFNVPNGSAPTAQMYYSTSASLGSLSSGQIAHDGRQDLLSPSQVASSEVSMFDSMLTSDTVGVSASTQSSILFSENTNGTIDSSKLTESPQKNSSFDQTFDKLCNLESLSNASMQKLQTIGVIPSTSFATNNQTMTKKSINEMRDLSSFAPLSNNQMSNMSVSHVAELNNGVPMKNGFPANLFDENFLQPSTNGVSGAPAIPPRSTAQGLTVIPRPEVQQRSTKGLLPPPIVTGGGGQRSTVDAKSDPFSDDFFGS